MPDSKGSGGSRETCGQSSSKPEGGKGEKNGGSVNNAGGVGGSVSEKPAGSGNTGSGNAGGSNTGSGDTGHNLPHPYEECRGIGFYSGRASCGGQGNLQPDGGYGGSTDVERNMPIDIPRRERPRR